MTSDLVRQFSYAGPNSMAGIVLTVPTLGLLANSKTERKSHHVQLTNHTHVTYGKTHVTSKLFMEFQQTHLSVLINLICFL